MEVKSSNTLLLNASGICQRSAKEPTSIHSFGLGRLCARPLARELSTHALSRAVAVVVNQRMPHAFDAARVSLAKSLRSRRCISKVALSPSPIAAPLLVVSLSIYLSRTSHVTTVFARKHTSTSQGKINSFQGLYMKIIGFSRFSISDPGP